MPQDVKLSPDGRIFYVADMHANGLWEIDAAQLPRAALPADRRGRARPLPEPRRTLPVRHEPQRGVDLGHPLPHAQGRRHVAACPAAAAPTWAASRPTARCSGSPAATAAEVYAISTRTGRLLARDPRRRRAARPQRLAAARPVLARAHRHPALTRARARGAAGRVARGAFQRPLVENPRDTREPGTGASFTLPRNASRSAPRHPLRARAHRAEDAAQPLLPGAALHRVRRREAVVAGAPPRRQGRGRLGRRQHGVLHDQRRVRRDAVRVGAHVGRGRRAAARARPATRRTATGRWPASSSRTRARTARTASRACRRRRRRRSRATSPPASSRAR